MINTGVSRSPASVTPGTAAGFGLFAFDTGDALAGQKHRDIATAVPCAIGHFSDFVNKHPLAAGQINPGGGGRCRDFWGSRTCCRCCSIRRWFSFFVAVFDLANFASAHFGSSPAAIPDSTGLLPRVVDVEC